MKTDLKQPCNECPFRRKAAPGWLGPWDAEGLLMSISMSGIPFTCHRTIPDDPDADIADMQMCAGAAIFLNNKFEIYRSRDGAAYQSEMKDIPEEIRKSVFDNRGEFVTHHTSSDTLAKMLAEEEANEEG